MLVSKLLPPGLNHIAAPCALQSSSLVQAALQAEIRAARAEGKYFEGVSDLPGQNIGRDGDPQELWVDELTGLPTLRNDLTIDRGMSFEAAAARLAHERAGGVGGGAGQ